jgi:uncharacterized protein (DUF2384 family)
LEHDLRLIPKDRIAHCKYEDFIENPAESLEKIYKILNIGGWEEYKKDIVAYAEMQRREHKPNIHNTDDDVIRRVNEHWDKMREDYKYEKREPNSK